MMTFSWTGISGEIILYSQVPLTWKSDLPKHVKSIASVTLINQNDFGAHSAH